jgi:hypothetical protein
MRPDSDLDLLVDFLLKFACFMRRDDQRVHCAALSSRRDGHLESALLRLESLSREEQNAIAAHIIDEASWDRSFQKRPEVLNLLASEALDEHRRGETRPLDELLG